MARCMRRKVTNSCGATPVVALNARAKWNGAELGDGRQAIQGQHPRQFRVDDRRDAVDCATVESRWNPRRGVAAAATAVVVEQMARQPVRKSARGDVAQCRARGVHAFEDRGDAEHGGVPPRWHRLERLGAGNKPLQQVQVGIDLQRLGGLVHPQPGDRITSGDDHRSGGQVGLDRVLSGRVDQRVMRAEREADLVGRGAHRLAVGRNPAVLRTHAGPLAHRRPSPVVACRHNRTLTIAGQRFRRETPPGGLDVRRLHEPGTGTPLH